MIGVDPLATRATPALRPGEVSAILQEGEGVFTSGQMAALGGMGGGDTYYIDARGADRAGLARLERLIHELNGSIEKRAVAAVYTSAARGGAIARMPRI